MDALYAKLPESSGQLFKSPAATTAPQRASTGFAVTADQERVLAAVRLLAELRKIFMPGAPGATLEVAELGFEVVDAQLLPTDLVVVTANEAAIRARYCAGWKKGDAVPLVPGIRFRIVERTAPSP